VPLHSAFETDGLKLLFTLFAEAHLTGEQTVFGSELAPDTLFLSAVLTLHGQGLLLIFPFIRFAITELRDRVFKALELLEAEL